MTKEFPASFAWLSRARNRRVVVGITLGTLPIIVAFVMMRRHWTSVPYGDEWWTPGTQIVAFFRGVLSSSDLWSQHNESRKLLPRLYYLTLTWLSGRWDVKDEMLSMFALACAASFALYHLLRRTISFALEGRLLAWALLNSLLFCPDQYVNFLWGIQLEPLIPGTLLLFAMLANLSDIQFQFKVIITAALALVATYSYANGMLLWLLAFPIQWQAQRGESRAGFKAAARWYAAYGLTAVISVGLYFFHYSRPRQHPGFVISYDRAGSLGAFVLRWIGGLFAERNADAFLLGLLVATAFVTLGLVALRSSWQDGDWKRIYPWFVLGAYGLMSGAVTAAGRLEFGPNAAIALRYGPVRVFCYIAVTGLAVSIYSKLWTQKKMLSRTAIFYTGAAAGILVIAWFNAFNRELIVLKQTREERKRFALAVQWIPAIPDNPELKLGNVPPATVVDKATSLSQRKLLRPRFVGEPLINQVQREPRSADSSNGVLEGAFFDDCGKLFVTGTARVPNQRGKPDCVVVGYVTGDHQLTPFAVFRPKFEQRERKERFRADDSPPDGFAVSIDASNLPKGALVLRAWNIDMAERNAFALAGSVNVQNGSDGPF
jgi:hypothetical protein